MLPCTDPKMLDSRAAGSLAEEDGLNDENTSHTRFLRPFMGRRVTHLQYRETSLGLQHIMFNSASFICLPVALSGCFKGCLPFSLIMSSKV